MKQLFQLTAYEIKYGLRSKALWLLGVLAIITMELPIVGLLLLLFFIVRAITRDEAAGFSLVISSLPHSTAILFLARALAVLSLLLGLWPFMLVVIGFFPQMAPARWLFDGTQFTWLTVKYIVTCLTVVGFVFFAGAVTRFSTRLYFITGFCWFAGWCFASNLADFPFWARMLLFGHGELLPTTAPAALTGYFLQQEMLPQFAVYQAGIALLLIVLAAGRQMARRKECILRSKLLIALGLTAIIAASTAGFSLWQELNNREKEFRLAMEEPVTVQTAPGIQAELQDYDLVVNLKTAAHHFAGTAVLKLKLVDRPSDVLCFTLRHCFAVEDVFKTGSGRCLDWQRDGSRLTVHVPEGYLPGDELNVTIVYSGQVWEWANGNSTRPDGPVIFLDPSYSLLRSGYAWYPVPGDTPLYTRKYFLNKPKLGPEFTLWGKRIYHPAVPFALTVNIDTDNTVVSNLDQTDVTLLSGEYKRRYRFTSLQGRDVFVIAGPYHYEKRKFPGRKDYAAVYCYPQDKDKLDKVMNRLMPQYTFYAEMLQGWQPESQAKTCTVVEVPHELMFSDVTLTDTILVNDTEFESFMERWMEIFGTTDLTDAVHSTDALQYWGQDAVVNGYSKGNIIDGMGCYLQTLYLEKTRGPVYYEQVKQALLIEERDNRGRTLLFSGPVVRDVFMVLDAIRTSELGDSAIQQIMRELYQVGTRKRTIDPADFSRAVKAVLAETNWPQARYDEINWRLESIKANITSPDSEKLSWKWGVWFWLFGVR